MKNQPQILIVDDEPIIRKTIKKLLSKYNLEVYLTGSPMEALDLIKREPIDLVLSDQRMPEMDGLSLIAQVKELSPNTICILMSGHSDVDLLVTAINSGSIYQYIPKPWENEKFLKTIFKALEVQIEEIEQNTIVQKLFANKKWIETLSQTRLTRRSDFLNNIIKHDTAISEELKREAKNFDVELEGTYQLCLLSTVNSALIKNNSQIADLGSKNELVFVINMIPNCIAWSCDEFICILLSGEVAMEGTRIKNWISNITDIVAEYCTNRFTMGISNRHCGLEELKSSYHQAYHAYLTVRGADQGQSGIAYYEELGSLQLLTSLNGSAEADEFIEHTLGSLIKYDKEKGSNLLQTLDVYLRTASMKEAAEKLYIHTKTMIFRKNRIEKILERSLEDYETRLSLGIALKLYSLR